MTDEGYFQVEKVLLLLRGDRPVAKVEAASPDEAQQLRPALEQAGYRVAEASLTEDGVIELEEECRLGEQERPCELKTVLGYLQDMGREAGVDTREVDAIWERGTTTEREAYLAAKAVASRLPDQESAQVVLEWGWPEGEPRDG